MYRRGRFIVPIVDDEWSRPKPVLSSLVVPRFIVEKRRICSAKLLSAQREKPKARAQHDKPFPMVVVPIHYRPCANPPPIRVLLLNRIISPLSPIIKDEYSTNL